MGPIEFYVDVFADCVREWRSFLLAFLGFLLWICCRIYSNESEVSSANKGKVASTPDLAVDARERLIVALLGDFKAADRLIAYEHSLAMPIGCGKLEAVERALLRLERDRSRVN